MEHHVEIDEIRLHTFGAQLHRPLRTARGSITSRTSILVALQATVDGGEMLAPDPVDHVPRALQSPELQGIEVETVVPLRGDG